MKKYSINSNDFLTTTVNAYFHTTFYGYGKTGNPDFLNILKNDFHHNWSAKNLSDSVEVLENIVLSDLADIQSINNKNLTVCVVPRSKTITSYNNNQLLFQETVKKVIRKFPNTKLVDGSGFIERHINTKTTHLRRPTVGFINDGSEPYQGISKDTCTFDKRIEGKDILLIDDIYTETVGIDEDMIQALFDNGAKSVIFYCVGKTKKRVSFLIAI
ncbi:amidophosphoribosyltransferase [Tenacibaculum finnmarkense genomovar ulcerans]|uniref:amidophosphoribosyltransferase n=1 Tax=Tenacibaculum finnmarkense TaxID=2781243 RepID=UPI00187B96F3|nr:amidophosphoribosyltransferase [Tenacibaculum finnmarkense]MBE7644806.1 amidophosphoribosyltransferase [Tenacibaculum finnmarkense genomovar ulcerans]